MSKFLAFCGLGIILFSAIQPTPVLNTSTSLKTPSGAISLTGLVNRGWLGSLTVQASAPEAEEENIVFSIFPACEYADTSSQALTECLQEIVLYSFFIGIALFFIRVTYIVIQSIASPGGGGTFKQIRESVEGLIVGIVFFGMPVTIMSLINPTTELITLNFIEELNMGPEASLIDVTPEASGCLGLTNCVNTCVTTRGGQRKIDCVANCKSNFLDCEECHGFIKEDGSGVDREEYIECIGGYEDGGEGTIAGCILDNLPENGTVELFRAQGGKQEYPVDDVKEVIRAGRAAGASDESIALAISIGTTEANLQWDIVNGGNCIGLGQFCPGTYEAYTLAILGRTPDHTEFLNDHEMQMKVMHYGFNQKYNDWKDDSRLEGKSKIFIMAAGWLGIPSGPHPKPICDDSLKNPGCDDGHTSVLDYATAAENNYNLLVGDCEDSKGEDEDEEVSATKLGLFMMGEYSPEAKEAINSGGVSIINVLNPWENGLVQAVKDHKEASPRETRVMRIFVPDGYKATVSTNPKAHAERVFDEIIAQGLDDMKAAGALGDIDYIVTANEFDTTVQMYNEQETQWTNDFWLRMFEKIEEYNQDNSTRVKPCGFSFAVSIPPADGEPFNNKISETLIPAFNKLYEMDGALCYHGYSKYYGQTMGPVDTSDINSLSDYENESTTAFRYRLILDRLISTDPKFNNLKVIIGETGIDFDGTEDGWRNRSPNSTAHTTGDLQDYLEWLEFYEQEISSGKYSQNVIGATIFQSGGQGAWSSYNVDEEEIMDLITGQD